MTYQHVSGQLEPGRHRDEPSTDTITNEAADLALDAPSIDEARVADDFTAGTDAPLGRAGVDRVLAND